MPRLGHLVFRHRRSIIVGWLLAAAAAGVFLLAVGGNLTSRQELPGSESVRAGQRIAKVFGIPDVPPVEVVLRSSRPLSAQRPLVESFLARFRRRYPTLRLESPFDARRGQAGLSADGRIAYVDLRFPTLEQAQDAVPHVREAVGSRLGDDIEVLVTGDPALGHDLEPLLQQDLHRAEAVALPLSLLVLLLVLGTLASAVVPLLLAAVALPTVLALVAAVSWFTDVSVYATNVVTMIGLGIVIDYSLLVVYRFREEIAAGRGVEEATARTSATALRAVGFSGVAVAVGLGVLVVLPVPFIRSMGLAGVLIPCIAIPAAMTFLPALLAVVGRRIDRWRILPERVVLAEESRLWRRASRLIARAPATFLVVGAALLLLVAAPVRHLAMGVSPLRTLPGHGDAVRGAQLLERAFGGGATAPIRILVDRPAAALAAVPARLARDPEVRGARIVGSRGDTTVLQVVGAGATGTEQADRLVDDLRTRLLPAALPPGATALVGGGPAVFRDFKQAIYGNTAWLVAGVVLVTYLILFRAFRSVVLPLKAVVMNLLSVAGAYGLLVLVFQDGVGSRLLGFQTTDEIAVWIPMFLFAFLFGLSMDYEVFLLVRMREEYDRREGRACANEEAVSAGLAKTGKIITSAAVIMVVAFGGLATGRVIEMQEFGFGLAAAILLDATLIRAFVVPSLMQLMGRWNWWLPRRLAPLAGSGPLPDPAEERP